MGLKVFQFVKWVLSITLSPRHTLTGITDTKDSLKDSLVSTKILIERGFYVHNE